MAGQDQDEDHYLHSIRSGVPDFNDYRFEKVSNYMTEHRGELGPYDDYDLDKTQTLNQELLQIISTGINTIVLNLKGRLGPNYTESDTSAKQIITRLNNLQAQINTEIGVVDDVNGLRSNDNERITLNENYEIKPIDNNYSSIDSNGLKVEMNNIEVRNNVEFGNLDSVDINVLDNQPGPSSLSLITDTGYPHQQNINFVQNRLKNCQNLEYLYLKKHNEIMKIFVFTISLFKKYKYAIKVMLYLLRYLVYKDPKEQKQPPPPPPPGVVPLSINIPRPVITSIGKLLKDQVKVQNIIDRMDHTINPGKPAPTPVAGVQDEGTADQARTKLQTVVPNNLSDENNFNVPAIPA